MYSIKTFEAEMVKIEDKRLIPNFMHIMADVEPDFYIDPASKTGKYHPPDSNGEGGLVRHSLRVATIAAKFAECIGVETDLMRIAGYLHDICKTIDYKEHARLAAIKIKEEIAYLVDDLYLSPEVKGLTDKWNNIAKMVESHMGKWGYKQPHTIPETAFHLADIAASMPEYMSIEFAEQQGKIIRKARYLAGMYGIICLQKERANAITVVD